MDSLPAKILMGCFGAQACISGILLGTSRMSKRYELTYGLTIYEVIMFFVHVNVNIYYNRAWQIFALAMLPFYGFNYYFYFVKPVFTKLMLMDVVGNSIFLGGSLLAASQMDDEGDPKDV